ncbi:MAG TPA: hypothetical protein PK007_10830, partial [Candidatus Kapabacteria bacterium]|nr:hypothetical protein [Candidatus Kapabacteria bacterium]
MNDFFNEYDDEFPEDIEEQFKRFRRAIRRRNRSQEDLPSADALDDLIDYSLSKSKFEDALAFCELLLEYNPASIDARNKKCVILFNLGRYKEA